jgi:hypothetical protein
MPLDPDEVEVWIHSTAEAKFDELTDRGRRLVKSMPLPMRQLVEVYSSLETQGRRGVAVVFIDDDMRDGRFELEGPPPSVVNDNPSDWIRECQDSFLALIVCYLDANGPRTDWDIPSTSLVFVIDWIEGEDMPPGRSWYVRLPGVLTRNPNRAAAYVVKGVDEVQGLLDDIRAILGTPDQSTGGDDDGLAEMLP